jgi:tetratricopeptide (TPR) repeat protein
MTNDTLWDIWEYGIQINLITSLSNTEELKVRQSETVNGLLKAKGYTSYMSITPSVASSITQKLDAAFFVSGIINQAGNTIRLNAQLIDAITEEPHRSFQIDGTPEMILQTIDSLSTMVHNTLIISKLGEERPDLLPKKHYFPTQSPEAYRYYTLGQTAYYKNDFPTAIEYFLQALSIDSSLASAMTNISTAYYNLNNYNQGRNWCLKSREKYDLMSLKDKIKNEAVYALYFRTLNDRIDCLRQLLALDDQNPMTWFNIGDCYYEMNEDYKAIPEFEKSLELFRKWGTKPYWGAFYYELGICYHRTGQFKKEKKLYRKADRDFPGDPGLMDQYAWLDFTLGDTAAANRHLVDLISVRKKESWSDARIAGYLAYVYDMAGMPEKTEECLRKALYLEPENPARMSSLANFLIDRERNVVEGLALAEKGLELQPDNYNLLHNKGWGFYKQGKYAKAVDILHKSWDLRMQNSIYNHKAFQHLEEAKRAAAGQNL